MTKLTEKSPYEDLYKAWDVVNDYGERAMRAKEMKPFFKSKAELFCRECNAPGKIRAFYVVSYDSREKRYAYMPFAVVEGSEGRSFIAREGFDSTDKNLFVIKSHAISRYMERHGWDGTREECERYVLSSIWVTGRDEDKITKEFIEYFDDGVFLGCHKGGIYYVNTYVANQHLYANQRLSSLNLQKLMDSFFEELDTHDLRIQKQGSPFGQNGLIPRRIVGK